MRVSTVPTLHGESVVLRLLDKEAATGRLDLELLGMRPMIRAAAAGAHQPARLVLATGPTGSGKTRRSTRRSSGCATGREKILTVEEPVEYQLAGIPQVPVTRRSASLRERAARTAARTRTSCSSARSANGETAEIATQAALTGHLVLSTLHTNTRPAH